MSVNLIDLRDKVIEKEFGAMNNRQFEAVTTINGPVLVLAGAGSGKTTVLVNRISCLVKYGSAYKSNIEPYLNGAQVGQINDYLSGKTDSIHIDALSVNPARPYEILAITFTNKAAEELKNRIALKLGEDAADVHAGTFHSICGRILRRYAGEIGYTSHFTIYDTDDQKKVLKEIMKQDNIDDKILPVKYVLKEISSAKDKLISPEEFSSNIGSDFRMQKVASLYKKYQATLINNDAMDFDDMIYNTVKLLKQNGDILNYYQNRFKYVMVDEYQDTNYAQYVLVSLLSENNKNICVVGDDDQSIYRFRGATIENILNFEDEYENCRVIRLEQNYRSTGNILNAANAVIKNNTGRKTKTLWTDKGNGSPLAVFTGGDERVEAKYIVDNILDSVAAGAKFSDHAVLYRMNAQSNAIENAFARSSVPYRVIGGMKFFERKEIKDILAYLAVINNPYDDLRLKRIVNEPKRSIGDTTVNNAQEIANSLGLSLFEVFKTASDYPMLSRAAGKLKEFCDIIEELRESAGTVTLNELFELTAAKTGYMQYLYSLGPTEQDRVDNIRELASSIAQYESENEEPTLSEFLEEIALFSDIDSMDSSEDRVILMTIHSAKGLEFEKVYLAGMEEGIFPGNQSIYGGPEDIEEERRLAYVAITRAKRSLTLTNASTRMLFGSTGRNAVSRFLKEIPEDLYVVSGGGSAMPSFSGGGRVLFNEPKYSVSVKSNSSGAAKSQYKVGLDVEHRTFGEGVILSVKPMADDSMLEINFKGVGIKKLMANYAKLKIL